jgi:Flp pilus assembly protein TadD
MAILALLLGLALLAKSTAVLLVPVIFGALVWRWIEQPGFSWRAAAARGSLVLGICLAVSGCHYARLWLNYGNPLIGVWDPKLANWWQDDGYRTSAFFVNGGQALLHPWFSALTSFPDGIYSTLWGDGLAGGAGDFFTRPPWNFDLMAVGYWLALIPTAGVVVGSALALRRFLREPSAEWFLLLGLGALVAVAMMHMSIAVPYSCMVKAFYGMAALVPLCAVAALGLDTLAGGTGPRRMVVSSLFGLWALNSYASFWIQLSSAPAVVGRVNVLIENRRYPEVFELLKSRLASDPNNADIRYTYAWVLTSAGMDQEALAQAARLARDHPGDCRSPYLISLNLERQGRLGPAKAEARRAVEMAPGFGPGWEQLARLLVRNRQFAEAVQASRRGLRIVPFNPKLRFALGCALIGMGDEPGAESELALSRQLGNAWPDADALLADARARPGRE